METVISTNKLTKNMAISLQQMSLLLMFTKVKFFGFLGANYAGKTTAMRMLCGLAKPSAGRAIICGYDIYKIQN